MRGREFAPNTFRRSGVLIGPIDSRPRNNIEITPLLVSGSIEVIGNYVDSSGMEPPTRTNGGAVFMAFLRGADVRIKDNVSVGCTRNCIIVTDALGDEAGRGSVLIAGNTVVSDVKQGFLGPGPRAPVGIDVSQTFNRTLALDPNMQHIPTLIADNYVELNGETAVGISAALNGTVIQGNTAVIHADAAKVDLLSGGITVGTSHFVVFQNTVMGEASSGIRIGGNALGLPRINNVLKANNITKMSPFRAHVLLDVAAQHNTIVGHTGTVIDGGTDNAITGFMPVQGGVGQAVSDAEQFWHDVTEILE
jgi:hypothetical protein